MTRKTKRVLIAAAAMTAIGAGGATIAGAASGDDDKPISGPALGKASAAALDHLGGGRVTGTEVGDEESYYEVEVTRPDGSQYDVQLDRGFNVVGGEADSDKGEKEGEGGG